MTTAHSPLLTVFFSFPFEARRGIPLSYLICAITEQVSEIVTYVFWSDYQTPPDSGLGAGRSTAYGQCRISRMGPSHSAGGREHR